MEICKAKRKAKCESHYSHLSNRSKTCHQSQWWMVSCYIEAWEQQRGFGKREEGFSVECIYLEHSLTDILFWQTVQDYTQWQVQLAPLLQLRCISFRVWCLKGSFGWNSTAKYVVLDHDLTRRYCVKQTLSQCAKNIRVMHVQILREFTALCEWINTKKSELQ